MKIKNGVLISVDENDVVDGTVEIPEGVTSIGYMAFANNKLTMVAIPEGVTSIDGGSFTDNELTMVTIPEGVSSIGYRAFANNKLTMVAIPEGITSIGDGAFANNKLTMVTIPEGVTSIGDDAFANNKLTMITIPEGVTSIGRGVFADNKLTNVTILEGVTSIGDWAFANNKLTKVTIPEGVTSIGDRAFANNKLTKVTIPEGVTSIDGGAFYGNAITEITIHGTKYKCLCADGIIVLVDNYRTVGNGRHLYKGQIFNSMINGELITKGCYVAEADGIYAHGSSAHEAFSALAFKLAKDRGAESYGCVGVDDVLPLDEAVTMYRVITGACKLGCEYFLEGLGEKIKDAYSPREIAAMTVQQYGNAEFARFWNL